MRKPIRILGIPVSQNGKYVITAPALTNKVWGWLCPTCNSPMVICPPQAGPMCVTCHSCNGKTYIQVVDPKQDEATTFMPSKPVDDETVLTGSTGKIPPAPTPRSNRPTRGELLWGNIFNRKKQMLMEGANIIGRNDPECKSDIMFDDPEMSRRSIRINAKPTAEGHDFILTVLKATNPVLINNQPVKVGKPIKLRSGAGIKMGNTLISFKINK